MITTDVLNGNKVIMKLCTQEYITDEYVEWMNKPVINQYLESRYVVQTIDTVTEYVKHNLEAENELLFAMISSEDNKHIGNFHLTFNFAHKRCFIAYVIGKDGYWGKGIATEAIKLATRWIFENYDVARLDGGMYSANIGSLRAVEKAGWKKEGLRRKWCLLDDGTRDDEIEVGILREEFEATYNHE